MSKQATISSLVRQSAKSEEEFAHTVLSVFADESPERIAEYFDRLNVPRSVEGENFQAPLMDLSPAIERVFTFEQEKAIGDGMQKYMDRHLKKIKWHAQRPSETGVKNVLLVMREGMAVTDLRLARLRGVLQSKDELTPEEWSMARELMNRAYLSFRHALHQLGGPWIDAVTTTLPPEFLQEHIGNFYELIDGTIRKLEEHREHLEERRMELTVLPRGYDPVKPPNYFGGDLMGRGPWTQFWSTIEDRAHHFREALG